MFAFDVFERRERDVERRECEEFCELIPRAGCAAGEACRSVGWCDVVWRGLVWVEERWLGRKKGMSWTRSPVFSGSVE